MPERAPRKKSSATKTARSAPSAEPGGARRAAKAAVPAPSAEPGGARRAAKAAVPAPSAEPGGARPAAGPGRDAAGAGRLPVRKTYKLFIGGAFPRSVSGRSYPVTAPDGTLLAHAALASRKDARDAVVAARKAFSGWSGATAYNRGQVLYRVAEMLEGRREQFVAEVAASEGAQAKRAQSIVDAAIDRWVWYAGWADKI